MHVAPFLQGNDQHPTLAILLVVVLVVIGAINKINTFWKLIFLAAKNWKRLPDENSQLFPYVSPKHLHIYFKLFNPTMHIPLFLHGFDKHGLTNSQLLPPYPTKEFLKVFDFYQVN